MTTYRAAVIGLGRMGSTFDDESSSGGTVYLPFCHTPSYVASPHTQLIAGVDPHEGQREIYAERWGVDAEHMYGDYRTMLEREQPDIVSVCTTTHIRPEIVETAARSGVRAIWAEKPMAFSLAEADRMVQVCADNSVTLAVNCARRWHPSYITARRLIDEGKIGELLQITHYAACFLSHNGSHGLDIMRYIAGGEVRWVFGDMESDEEAAGDRDLVGNGYLAFEDGVRGYFRGMSTGDALNWDMDIIGSAGRIRLLQSGAECELYIPVPGGPKGTSQPARIPFPQPAYPCGMGLTIVEDLVGSIEAGRDPSCSGRDGRAALKIAIAMRESHRRGGVRVHLPVLDRSLRIQSAEAHADNVPARVRREKAAAGRA